MAGIANIAGSTCLPVAGYCWTHAWFVMAGLGSLARSSQDLVGWLMQVGTGWRDLAGWPWLARSGWTLLDFIARTLKFSPHPHRIHRICSMSAPRPRTFEEKNPCPHRIHNMLTMSAPHPRIFKESNPCPHRNRSILSTSAPHPHRIRRFS